MVLSTVDSPLVGLTPYSSLFTVVQEVLVHFVTKESQFTKIPITLRNRVPKSHLKEVFGVQNYPGKGSAFTPRPGQSTK
ncbi:unnamed protein product, partial [Cyprideis torosa]